MDWIYINGVRCFADCFLSNLMKTRPDLAERAVRKGTLPPPEEGPNLLDETIRELKQKGALTLSYRMRSTMTLCPPDDKKGRPVRVWLPLPNAYAQVKNVQVLSCSAPRYQLSRPDAPQRTVCWRAGRGRMCSPSNTVTEIHASYVEADPARVTDWQPSFYTEEALPHIRFTPFLKDLAREITGDEKNPLLKARLIYDYITHHIRYSFLRAYKTMPMITEFAAAGGKGDCGVQALLFITPVPHRRVPAHSPACYTRSRKRRRLP